MIISHKHRFIFVKTRKTAGSTFEKLVLPYLGEDDICTGSTRDDTPALNIKPDTNGHLPLSEIISRYFPDGTDYNIISIERNPYDKVVSSYFWHQHIKPDQYWGMHFDTYMKTCNLLPQDWGLYTIHDLLPTTLKMFHYEAMDEIYLWLKKTRGINISLDTVAGTRLKSGLRGKLTHYSELFSPMTQKVVQLKFYRELEEFKYEWKPYTD
jgi:hypothetical protein